MALIIYLYSVSFVYQILRVWLEKQARNEPCNDPPPPKLPTLGQERLGSVYKSPTVPISYSTDYLSTSIILYKLLGGRSTSALNLRPASSAFYDSFE